MANIDTGLTVYTLYIMKTRIAKWGNSLALRLPKSVVMSQSLKEGSEVEVIEHEEGILLRPATTSYDLSKLLEGIQPSNVHSSIETSKRTGKEVW